MGVLQSFPMDGSGSGSCSLLEQTCPAGRIEPSAPPEKASSERSSSKQFPARLPIASKKYDSKPRTQQDSTSYALENYPGPLPGPLTPASRSPQSRRKQAAVCITTPAVHDAETLGMSFSDYTSWSNDDDLQTPPRRTLQRRLTPYYASLDEDVETENWLQDGLDEDVETGTQAVHWLQDGLGEDVETGSQAERCNTPQTHSPMVCIFKSLVLPIRQRQAPRYAMEHPGERTPPAVTGPATPVYQLVWTPPVSPMNFFKSEAFDDYSQTPSERPVLRRRPTPYYPAGT